MTKTDKPLYSDEVLRQYLEDNALSDTSMNPAWDLERSSAMGTLKEMIRKYHTVDTANTKPIALAQVLRIEEGMKSLYETINTDDTETTSQLIRYRVLSDRRHYWLPEPRNNLSPKDKNIIDLHPLAMYKMPTGDTASPLKAGDIVEVQFKDNKTPYSSYMETALVVGFVGNVGDSSTIPIKNRCANVTLPPIQTSAEQNIATDPCLIVGNVEGMNVQQLQAAAAAASTKVVFPRFPVATGEDQTSEFGKVRTTTRPDGTKQRRVHYGADYELKMHEPVLAALDGRVYRIKYNKGGFGYYIILEHEEYALTPDRMPTKFWTLYAHFGQDPPAGSQPYLGKYFGVKEGQQVKRGTRLGLGGNSGLSVSAGGGDGSHLHFEYIVPIEGQKSFPPMSGDTMRDTRKDPRSDFFRRAFFKSELPTAWVNQRRTAARKARKGPYGGRYD